MIHATRSVRYSFFAPLGLRSATSIRMVFHQTEGRQELFKTINANTVIVPQLESITAVANLDEILKVEGLNYFGGGTGGYGPVPGASRSAYPSQSP